jgi:20S proteasome alpha/beta subunit
LIFGGVDRTGPCIFLSDPSGTYLKHIAISIGAFEEQVIKIVEEEHHNRITIEETIQLAVQSLSKKIETKMRGDRLRVAIISTETKVMKRLTSLEVANCMNQD